MILVINGESREIAEGTTVGEVVRAVTKAASGVAVALNDEVVRRGSWDSTALTDGDKIEVLTAVQGG